MTIPTPAPGTPIRIGGSEFVLRFDYAGLCALEQAVGNMQAIEAISGNKPVLTRPRDLLFAGLRHARPALTLEDAAALVDQYLVGGGTIKELGRLLSEAIAESPFLRSVGREAPAPAANGTGGSPTSPATSPTASAPPPAASG